MVVPAASWEIFSKLAHIRFVVRASGQESQMIGVLIKDEPVYGSKPRQVCFGLSTQLDLRGQLNFVFGPALDGNRACGAPITVTVPP